MPLVKIDGTEQEAEETGYTVEVPEQYAEYLLDNGTRVRVKLNVTNIYVMADGKIAVTTQPIITPREA